MNCPNCGRPMEEVRYPAGESALNRHQWAAVRAGDWWCEADNLYWFADPGGGLRPGHESPNNRRNPEWTRG
jgi:hypothetical protein